MREGDGATSTGSHASPDAGAAGARTTSGRPPNRVHVTWRGRQRFDSGRPGGPVALLDGSGESGQSPVDAVLSALAGCASADVVEILAKRRTPVAALEIDVTGTRVDTIPRRLRHIELVFRITGEGIEREHAERAVELAITKYCSVRDSLRPDIEIEWRIELKSGS